MIKSFFRLIIFLLLCTFHLKAEAQGTDEKVALVERMMQLYHGFPRPLDDSLCHDVLHDYLQALDPEHLYFSKADIRYIQLTTDMNGGLRGRARGFLNPLISLYRQRLLWADTVIRSILQTPFDFSTDDQIILATDSSPYAAGENELKQRWYTWLKYESLHRITDILLYDSTATKDYLLQQQDSQKKIVLKTEERRINKVLHNPAGYENYMASFFCNTLAGAYDPHSEFFPETEKENFVGAVSGGGYSFGFEYDDNDKLEVEIVHILPGTPAWKCGQLNEKDVLLQMQWEGEPPIDLAGAEAEEVDELLAGDNHRLLKLTVHKANGVNVTVALRKEITINDEDYVQSSVLNGENKIGYILLPGFYSEWENTGSSASASDVIREISKLKKENIAGLILDLRNNGGGSLEEALALAGIFIHDGVFGINRDRGGPAHAMKDPNRGSIYDGPLLVMINGETASASELVVGALQDYKRAIIAGSPTFGKATYQIVLPCDTTIRPDKVTQTPLGNGNNDYVKITLGKLYRVTGKSNQANGVTPDIPLPNPYGTQGGREVSLKHALATDTVRRARHFSDYPALPLAELAAKSRERVQTSHSFELVQQCYNLYCQMNDVKAKAIPLNFDAFVSLAKIYGVQGEKLYHELEKDSLRSYEAVGFSERHNGTNAANYDAEQNDRFISDLMHDIYINESYLILSDYIKMRR